MMARSGRCKGFRIFCIPCLSEKNSILEISRVNNSPGVYVSIGTLKQEALFLHAICKGDKNSRKKVSVGIGRPQVVRILRYLEIVEGLGLAWDGSKHVSKLKNKTENLMCIVSFATDTPLAVRFVLEEFCGLPIELADFVASIVSTSGRQELFKLLLAADLLVMTGFQKVLCASLACCLFLHDIQLDQPKNALDYFYPDYPPGIGLDRNCKEIGKHLPQRTLEFLDLAVDSSAKNKPCPKSMLIQKMVTTVLKQL